MQLKSAFYQNSTIKTLLPGIEKAVLAGKISSTKGATQLLQAFLQAQNRNRET
ncbi:MAG: hypothetical protein ACK4TA_22960 [Saprospiraceae bacterium]